MNMKRLSMAVVAAAALVAPWAVEHLLGVAALWVGAVGLAAYIVSYALDKPLKPWMRYTGVTIGTGFMLWLATAGFTSLPQGWQSITGLALGLAGTLDLATEL